MVKSERDSMCKKEPPIVVISMSFSGKQKRFLAMYLCLCLRCWRWRVPTWDWARCRFRGDRADVRAGKSNFVGTLPFRRYLLLPSWWKQSSSKCAEHNLEYLVGVRSLQGISSIHALKSSGSPNGNLWQYRKVWVVKYRKNNFQNYKSLFFQNTLKKVLIPLVKTWTLFMYVQKICSFIGLFDLLTLRKLL